MPLLSVTVQVTVFVPTGNCAGALLVTTTEPQLSVAVMVPKATPVAKHEPTLAFTVTSAGQAVITGFCVSVIVTVNVHEAWFPPASVAMLVTVVTPTGNTLPLAGMLTRLVTLQLSVAVTTNVTLLRPHWPGSAVRTMLVGQVMTGGSVSLTVTAKVFTLKVHTV